VGGPGVLVRREAGVAEIALARPGAMNALSTALAAELTAACTGVCADDGIGAVVLAAEGERAFCVGADLRERAAFGPEQFAAQRRVFRDCFAAVAGLPQPAVAAVFGFALGGGCELALACDLIVADETATFALPEVSLGLVPGGGGTQRTVRRLGAGRAADLVLTGRRVGAVEAERIGLADRLVGAGEARAAAWQLARTIAGHSPVAVRAAKQALRGGDGVSIDVGLAVEDAAWRTAAFSADRAEGIAAFTVRRRPEWPGLAAVPGGAGRRP
jgi:enoyl-CoA hydratase/carnithine racemase